MAHIFCYVGKRLDAADVVLSGLKLARYRGYDSWGMITQRTDGRMMVERHPEPLRDHSIDHVDAHIAMGHMRWATRGMIAKHNTHPIMSTDETIAVVHNGYIDDYDALHSFQQDKGCTFHTQTDTEVIVSIIEQEYKGGLSMIDATRRAALRIEGKNSFVAMFPGEERLIVVQQGLPLYMGTLKGEFFISSHPAIITPFTSTLVALEKGQCAIVDDIGIELKSVGTRRSFTVKTHKSPYIYDVPTKKPYDHFLLKEIMEIDTTIEKALQPSRKTIERFVDKMKGASPFVLVGAGSSHWMAHAGMSLIQSSIHIPTHTIAASEFHTIAPILTKDSVVCILSQSGETVALFDVVASARAKGSSVIAMLNTVPSPLFPLCDVVIQLQTEAETSVVASKSAIAQLTWWFFTMLIVTERFDKGKDTMLKLMRDMRAYHKKEDIHMPIKHISELFHQYDHIVVIGKGLMYSLACETAHKIQEVTGCMAQACPAGELKHSLITTLSSQTLLIALVEGESDCVATLCAVHQARAHGAYCLGISSQSYTGFDAWLAIPQMGVGTPIVYLFFIYLWIYYGALAMHRDPDTLSSLTKVTYTY